MPEAGRILHALATNDGIDDEAFDRLYPPELQQLSDLHFTPFAVARRAAAWLAETPQARILDVGSGVGKFCLVGALTTRATFYGVEQRGHFVEVARQAAARLRVRRVHFLHANLLAGDWRGFTGFYLFNPFAEHVSPDGIDDAIVRSPVHHQRYVQFTQGMLALAPTGARVVTYHGFGGPLPEDYRHVRREVCGTEALDLWVKASSGWAACYDRRPRTPRTSAPHA